VLLFGVTASVSRDQEFFDASAAAAAIFHMETLRECMERANNVE
jgi:hypothetical protein